MTIDSWDPQVLWPRLERSLESAPVVGERPTSTELTPEDKERRAAQQRRWIVRLDVISIAFWIYLISDIFILDIDRLAIEALVPALAWLLDFRLLAWIGLVALGLLAFGRRFWIGVAYVALFPLLVVVWKIPGFFWRMKSWPLLLAVTQAVFSMFSGFRYKVISAFLWLLAAASVLFASGQIAAVAALALTLLLAVSMSRTIWRSVTGRSFFEVQRTQIQRLLASQRIQNFLALNDQYKRTDIDRYETTDAHQILNSIGMSVALVRALHLWAYHLERYRSRYRPSFMFAGLSYLWLLAYSVLTLSLANLGLFKFDPQQFGTDGSPSLIAFALYSFGSMALSPTGGIEAVGDVALALQLLAAFAGFAFLAQVVLSILMTFRRERDDQATSELVAQLRGLAAQQEDRFQNEYALSVDDAERKLRDIGYGFASFIGRLSQAIPRPSP